jgi:clan AA aspartic protease
MAQEVGYVTRELESILKVRLINGSEIECALDTGFNGFLLLPRTFIESNLLPVVGNESVTMVEQNTTEVEVAAGEVIWLDSKLAVRILVSENDECLIGTQMLVDSKLEIDYKDLTVKITK